MTFSTLLILSTSLEASSYHSVTKHMEVHVKLTDGESREKALKPESNYILDKLVTLLDRSQVLSSHAAGYCLLIFFLYSKFLAIPKQIHTTEVAYKNT